MMTKHRSLSLVFFTTWAALSQGEVWGQVAAPTNQPERTTKPPMASQPLTLNDVLARTRQHHPLILAALRDQEVAEGEQLTARGSFDPLLRLRGDGTLVGYYQGGRLDLTLEQPTPLWGLSVFGGYRVSLGKFADYDGKLETNEYGELRAGMQIPLWRNGPIDRRRANITRANLGTTAAKASVRLQRVELIRAATVRYWDWVAAGLRLRVAQSLETLAVARDEALRQRVSKGDAAAIERIDNQRALQQRMGLTAAARRSLEAASFELSLYVRGDEGQVLVPGLAQLPTALPLPPTAAIEQGEARVQADFARACTQRPDLQRLSLSKAQLQVERDWARNQAAPGIDAQVAVSQDLGPGLDSRAPTVLDASLLIDIPTLNRAAKGRVQAATAGMARLDAQLRLQGDRILLELRDALSAMEAARLRTQAATAEVALAARVENAERERFTLGDSTLFVVNLREQATVEAQLREIDATVEYYRALAGYHAALANEADEPAGANKPTRAP